MRNDDVSTWLWAYPAVLVVAIALLVKSCQDKAAFESSCKQRGGHIIERYPGGYSVQFCIGHNGAVLE